MSREPKPGALGAPLRRAPAARSVPLVPMRHHRRNRTVLACALLAHAPCVAVAAQQRVVAAPAAVIAGTVVAAENDEPLAGVRVALQVEFPWHHPAAASFRQPEPVATGPDGTFSIGCSPPAGTLAIRIEADGRVPTEDALLPLASANLGTIRLRRGVLVTGVVLDQDHRPVEALRLRQPTGFTPRKHFAVYANATTRRDGSFVFDSPLPPGLLLPAIENEGFEVISDGARIEDDGEHVQLRVARRRSISGVVFSDRRRPLQHVEVAVREPRWPSRTETRVDGSFVLFAHADARDRADLVIGGNGAFATTGVRDVSWGVSGIEVTIAAPATLPLFVVERGTDTPVERFGIYLRSYAEDARLDTRIRYADRPHRGGRLALHALRKGENRILVIPCDHALAPAEVFVEVGEAAMAELRVEVERLRPVEIRVVDGGLPQRVDVEVIDHRGTDQVRCFEDPRHYRWCFPDRPTAIRLASARTDGDGRAILLLPSPDDGIQLVVRGSGSVRLPLPSGSPGAGAEPIAIDVAGANER